LPTPEELENLQQLKTVFNAEVPSGSTIALASIRDTLSKKNSHWVKRNFSQLVQSIQIEAYERYLAYEKIGWQAAFTSVFGPLLHGCSSSEELAAIIIDNFYTLDKFFLGLTQGRRVRAGRAFEVLIREFFTMLGYRCGDL